MSRARSGWGDGFRLLLRPESGYRRLASRATPPSLRGLRRPLFVLLTAASMVSILTAGRLTLTLVADAFLAWSYVPALHVGAAALTARVLAGRRLPLAQVIDLYFIGFGPWLLWMVGITGVALFIPSLLSPSDETLWRIVRGGFFGGAAVAFVWSAWVNLGYFRGALQLTLPKAALAVVTVRGIAWGFAVSYFHLSDQLLPRLPWVGGQG